jgi:apolipoprotein D and lipocalin family protein
MRWIFMGLISFLLGCSYGYPETATPVKGFELERYLGKWYEIARLDHSFERGLTRVTAEYAMRDDGGVKVTNRGFDPEKNEWNQAVGKAYFVGDAGTGHLKVSFFGPFYGSYVVFELEKEGYAYAFVASSSTSYLWFLSRTPTVSDELKERFVAEAKRRGFDTSELIFVDQKQP